MSLSLFTTDIKDIASIKNIFPNLSPEVLKLADNLTQNASTEQMMTAYSSIMFTVSIIATTKGKISSEGAKAISALLHTLASKIV